MTAAEQRVAALYAKAVAALPGVEDDTRACLDRLTPRQDDIARMIHDFPDPGTDLDRAAVRDCLGLALGMLLQIWMRNAIAQRDAAEQAPVPGSQPAPTSHSGN